MRPRYPLVSVPEWCALLGYSKQAYYKAKKVQPTPSKAELVVALIQSVRATAPRMGIRKCIKVLEQMPAFQALEIGRDQVFAIARAHDLLVPRVKRYTKTTDSKGWHRQFPNLLKGLTIKHPEQVWVADITYLGKGLFLHLITDAYSKKIMGFEVSDDLKAESSLVALQMAVGNRCWPGHALIHHSDRGLQYLSKVYCQYLRTHHITSSTTQDGSPYDNAVAERVNGILKQEFLLEDAFTTLAEAKAGVAQAIAIYNNYRPHYSNHFLTPAQMHAQKKLQIKTWQKRVPSPGKRQGDAGSAGEQPISNNACR